MKSIKNVLVFCGFLVATFSSCIDTELESVVEYKNHYNTIPDADNAILGLYGSFMKLAEQTIVLGELRADLMDVTINSSVDLQEINTNTPSVNNKYADITNYYFIIQNCNDMMAGFDDMLARNKMTADEYAERYSDVATVRCWTYLQLGMHFGKVVYVTDPTVSVEDAVKLEYQQSIKLEELLPLLIDCMEKLPSLEDYQNCSLVKYKLDGYDLKYFFINKRLLLGDLYLWNGDYLQAATQYRRFLATDEDKAPTANYTRYRCGRYPTGGDIYFQIYYDRNMDGDQNSYHNTWLNMFSYQADKTALWSEMIWTISYDQAFEPSYPFIELFANQGQGKYQLRPSEHAINNLWGAQVQNNGAPFDGRGQDASYKLINGEYVVQKYLYDYDPAKPYEKRGRWFLNRAGMVMLRYAEAANRCGYPKLAWAILNGGFKYAYQWDDEEHQYKDLNSQTGWGPGKPYPEPFYFDAREIDFPYHRAPWRTFAGIRGRALLKPKEIPADCITTQDSIWYLEKELIEEAALEGGFEGYRWGDLVRVARRMNKEKAGSGTEYLNAVIAPKYEQSGTVMPDLSSEDKWYLNIVK